MALKWIKKGGTKVASGIRKSTGWKPKSAAPAAERFSLAVECGGWRQTVQFNNDRVKSLGGDQHPVTDIEPVSLVFRGNNFDEVIADNYRNNKNHIGPFYGDDFSSKLELPAPVIVSEDL